MLPDIKTDLGYKVKDVLLSILETKDKTFISKRIETLSQQLELTEVEKKIIFDIKDNLQLDNIISIEFLKSKYSYYVLEGLTEYLDKEAIDSAIVDIRIKQLKTKLSKEIITLGGQINKLSPEDIKVKLSELHSNAIVETSHTTPDSSLAYNIDPYGDMIASKEGLSLVVPRIEEHAGKLKKGTVVTVAAFVGSFKSTFALNFAYQNTLNKYNILYLALEDSGDKIVSRMVLNHMAVTAKDKSELVDSLALRDGRLNTKQRMLYNEKHNDLVKKTGKHLILWDTTQFEYNTFIDMTNTLRKADKEFKDKTGKGLDCVVVDQISLLKYSIGSGKRTTYDGQIINDWVSYFRNQSLNFLDDGGQVAVLLIAQTSRDAFTEANKPKKKGRYEASCVSDSHEVERASYTMITLFKDYDQRDTLLINIPKARQGYSPENPIPVELYGQYFHIGPLPNLVYSDISASDFSNTNSNIGLDKLLYD